jgi:probable F420-dependent oxidoreductase
MRIGGRGVFFYPDGLTSREVVAFARRLEALGYSALWLPEVGGRDPFVTAARILDHTDTLVVATGIANIYARDAIAMKAAQYTLAEQSAGRFLLGIGVSHRLLVEDIRGHHYGPPLTAMKTFLARYAAASYGAVEPAERPPLLLAALGPKMLELAREQADGAHPYMVTPAHTCDARKILGPDRLLCTEHKVHLQPDLAKARAIARATPALAMGLTLPNYRNSLIRQGFEAKDFEPGLSDRLVEALVALGDADAIERRLREHVDAGADHVCIHPLHPEAKSEPDWPTLEALAPVNRRT